MLPCANYLKFLITLGKKDKDIIVEMGSLGFEVEKKDLAPIRNSLMLPPMFAEYAKGKRADEKFLLKYASRFNIKEAWRYQLRNKPPAMGEALQLAKDPQVRLVPVILAIKGYPRYDEALMELGREFSAQSVQLLVHYFFDIKSINMTGWRKFFKKFSPEAFELLNQPLDYILFKLGLNPALAFTHILNDLMHMGFYKAKSFLSVDTKDYINMGKIMADLAIKAGERLQKYGKGETYTFLEDVTLAFEKADLPIPEIEELKEGEDFKPLTLI